MGKFSHIQQFFCKDTKTTSFSLMQREFNNSSICFTLLDSFCSAWLPYYLAKCTDKKTTQFSFRLFFKRDSVKYKMTFPSWTPVGLFHLTVERYMEIRVNLLTESSKCQHQLTCICPQNGTETAQQLRLLPSTEAAVHQCQRMGLESQQYFVSRSKNNFLISFSASE